ncbi:MAG: hypothetical protein HRU70_13245 [Phycisphaeraceae bacterium]|nr:MAG: hypothetical protein HRU70_13245 [Phycisphaeraceae bacterium]
MSDHLDHADRPPVRRRTPVLLVIAALALVAGLALWGYAAATRPQPTHAGQPSAAPSGDGPALGLDSASNDAPGGEASAKTDPLRMIDSAGPALARLGGSFVVAYAVGMLIRRFIRTAMLCLGVIAVTLYLLHRFDIYDADLNAVWEHLGASLTWLKGEAEGLKTFLTGYLPSSVAAGVGLVQGLRGRAVVPA